MKRISALLIALLVLCCAMSTTAFAAEEKALWVTHYNDNAAEGSGVIFTTTYDGGAWWNHYAFKPVEGTNAFELVEISRGDCTASTMGQGTFLAIPEGGFVYCQNTGNDYPSIGGYDGMPNYTSDACNASIADANTWVVGDVFVFTGLDLEGLTVPTSTPDVNWYDAAYVCTASYSVYEAEGGEAPAESEEATDSEAPAESEEATESAEDSSAVVEESKEESKEETKTETSKEESKDATTSTATSEAPAEEGGNTMIWIIVGAVIVVVVVVVIVVAKKKK